MSKPIVVGTRGSALALWQADFVISQLRRCYPHQEFEIRPIRTSGDRLREAQVADIGTRGIFVDEIRRSLGQGEVDLAVHSVKDLPNDPTEGIWLAIVGPREDARDAIVSRGGDRLDDLPSGARVGTGSPRRAAQLLARRPELVIESIRGNVDTRVRKALSGEFDAVVLAVAGLKRLGLMRHASDVLSLSEMTPAPGQGAIGVEARSADSGALELLRGVDHWPSHAAVRAEQEFARSLGGGCTTPIGAYASLDGTTLHLMGVVASVDGRRMFRGEVSGGSGDAKALGAALACQLIEAGADAIVAEIRVGDVGMGPSED